MKPDWKDAPEFAKYLAQDSDGSWFWFGSRPRAGTFEWICDDVYAQATSPRDKSWRETLEERPQ